MAKTLAGSTCVDSKGKSYRLDKSLGKGGEGEVFSIAGMPNSVAKIYIPEKKYTASCPRDFMEEKIKVMLRHPVQNPYDSQGNLLIAWPTEILYCGGEFVGYVMPKISQSYKLFDMYRDSRVDLFKNAPGGYSWVYSYITAFSLALSVQRVHEAGHLVGDMNPSNFFVTSSGSVIMIDTDSFDIVDPSGGGKNYKCMVAFPDYLAPELQGRNLALPTSKFTKEADCFSLAINIFRLLMNGNHPFNCKRVTGAVKSVAQSGTVTAIAKGECPYVRSLHTGVIPDSAPDFLMLPEDIRELFDKAFNYTESTARSAAAKRPSAEDWVKKLSGHYNDSEFKKCSKDSHHIFFKAYGRCPWCAIQNKQQIVVPNPPPQPIRIPKTATTNYPPAAPQNNNTFFNNNNTFTNKTTVYRSAGLLYLVYIIAGIASGFFLGGPLYAVADTYSDIGIPPLVLQIILAVIGGLISALIARWCSEKYKTSYRVWPWYLLALVLPLATALAGAAVVLVLMIAFAILYIIAVIVGVICACTCCNSG